MRAKPWLIIVLAPALMASRCYPRVGVEVAPDASGRCSADVREYPVLDARVSCGWLFGHWPDVANAPASTERAGLTLADLLALYVSLDLLSEQIPELPQ